MAVSLTAAVLPTDQENRALHGWIAGVLVAWLAYTRLFWVLQPAHLTLPTCPFLLITGHPCPFCGGTRSYAWMWRGDIGSAFRLYPLGPLLFLLTFVGLGYALLVVLSGKVLEVRVPAKVRRWGMVFGALVLGTSWAMKLVWLGN